MFFFKYLFEFETEFENIFESIWIDEGKNQKLKIARHCPFKIDNNPYMVIRCPTVANSFSFLILRDFCRFRCPHSCKQFSIADFKRFLQTFTVYLFFTSPKTKFHPS
jgi:hypothetical protein